jgi:hypothetical protein
LLTASGSNFEVPQVNFYRALQSREPEAIARTVALTFMGTRADQWPPGQLSDMAVFFSSVGYKSTKEWKEEIVFWDPEKALEPRHPLTRPSAVARAAADKSDPLSPTGRAGRSEGHPAATSPSPRDAGAGRGGADQIQTGTSSPQPFPPLRGREGACWATFPDGTRANLKGDRDPRAVFADWLIDPQNPWFTRTIVNRVWSWLLGRGLIDAPDDIRADNPPSDPELLAFLEQELISSHYDLKHIYRLILNSKTYQLSCVPRAAQPQVADHFACYPLRRLEAEVLIDAINQVTGSSEQYSSPIPEPFTVIPAGQRSIALPDGSITSSFLELFGRPPRDTGLESERNNRITAAQRLHLLNSSHIQRQIEQSRMVQAEVRSSRTPREITAALYLGVLSRFPTEDELKSAETYLQSGANRRQAVTDLAWALINSAEFLYRH